jgi:CheY-like chemotaxis protein
VAIRWTQNQTGGLDLSWAESGGPLVSAPSRRGFGSTLIERALAMETDGQATLSYHPSGVICEVMLPASSLVAADNKGSRAKIAFSNIPERPVRSSNSLRVLVIEDSFMIVSTLELALNSFGWTMVGPATRVPKALALVKTENFDVALLDVNLDGEMSWAVAEALQAREIPFVLSTGYELGKLIPESLKANKFIRKPYSLAELEKSILDVIKYN